MWLELLLITINYLRSTNRYQKFFEKGQIQVSFNIFLSTFFKWFF